MLVISIMAVYMHIVDVNQVWDTLNRQLIPWQHKFAIVKLIDTTHCHLFEICHIETHHTSSLLCAQLYKHVCELYDIDCTMKCIVLAYKRDPTIPNLYKL